MRRQAAAMLADGAALIRPTSGQALFAPRMSAQDDRLALNRPPLPLCNEKPWTTENFGRILVLQKQECSAVAKRFGGYVVMPMHPTVFQAAKAEADSLQSLAPYEVQPKWRTPAEIVIGATFGGSGHPAMGLGEYIDAVSGAIDAGACWVDIDTETIIGEDGRSLGGSRAETLAAVLGPLRARHGNCFVACANILSGDTFEECLSPALSGLAEVVSCAAGHPERFVLPAAEVLGRCSARLQIEVHSTGEVELAKRRLVDTGRIKPPYHFVIRFGAPFHTGRSLNSGVSVTDAEDMARHLFGIVTQIRQIDPASVITVAAAGRSTLYLTTLATMMGLHVQVGTRDTPWKHPHSDERLESTRQMVEMARSAAVLHGRQPAGAEAYRAMLTRGAAQ